MNNINAISINSTINFPYDLSHNATDLIIQGMFIRRCSKHVILVQRGSTQINFCKIKKIIFFLQFEYCVINVFCVNHKIFFDTSTSTEDKINSTGCTVCYDIVKVQVLRPNCPLSIFITPNLRSQMCERKWKFNFPLSQTPFQNSTFHMLIHHPHRGIDGPTLWPMSFSLLIIGCSLENLRLLSGHFNVSFTSR